jgi:hypothetical protein
MPRWKNYQQNVSDFATNIGAEETAAVIQAKVLDFLSRDFSAVKDMSAQELQRHIETLFSRNYAPFIDQAFRQYDSLLNLVNVLYNDLGYELNRDLPKIQRLEVINQQRLGKYTEDESQRIQRAIRKSLKEGAMVSDVEKALQGISKRVTFYSETLARTQLRAYGREAKNEKARVAEVEYFQYVGAFREKKIRPFCRKYYLETLHLDAIRDLDDYLETGQMKPVLRYCGGWNCVHDWEPAPEVK